jgi:hypothetical protein
VGFQISALRRDHFEELFRLDEEALALRGAKWYVADKKPGYPCRISLQDAEPGERVVLVPFCHQSASSPYRATGPVFVREAAQTASVAPNTVPALLRTRLLSVRAYDDHHLMTGADVIDGRELEPLLTQRLASGTVGYIHVHFAGPGCYACRVDRVRG